MDVTGYGQSLASAERVDWSVEDLIGGGRRPDFSRPFLPESLARTGELGFLTRDQKRHLNQIRAHGYLAILGIVEEFILPFVLDHARADLGGAPDRTQALLGFAAEEAKHIQLFRRYREELARGLPVRCEVIGPPEGIARAVLSHDPLGVALTALHVEWMTQRHYVAGVRDEETLDPLFLDLLKHHWMDEARHARLDGMMIRALARERDEARRLRAVDDYLAIGVLLDCGLERQCRHDLAALEAVTGRRFTEGEREKILLRQHQAQRWTYLGCGMTHREVLRTVGEVLPAGRRKVRTVASSLC